MALPSFSAAQIEGYPGQRSYLAGEKLTLHLSSDLSPVTVRIQRVGGETQQLWSREGVQVGKHVKS